MKVEDRSIVGTSSVAFGGEHNEYESTYASQMRVLLGLLLSRKNFYSTRLQRFWVKVYLVW